VERDAARHKEPHRRCGRGDDVWRRLEHVLEVVEHEQELPVTQVAGKSLADVIAALGDSKGSSYCRQDEPGIRQRREADEEDSVREGVE
jgi:hypothetical protein